jgi:hypothetical protein
MEPPVDCVHRVIDKLNELPDLTIDPNLEAELKQRMQSGVLSDKSTSSPRNMSSVSAKKRQPKRPIIKTETDTKSSDSTPVCDSVSTSPEKGKTKRSREVTVPKKPCIKYLSTAGCTNSNCKFAHRLPLDKDETTKVSSLQLIYESGNQFGE